MRFPFFNVGANRQEQILAIDLGSRRSKAVFLQRKGEGLSLRRYAIQDAPIYEKALSPALLAEHLRGLVQTVAPKNKQVTLAIGPSESILRSTDLPLLPLSDLRQMLKFNTKNYLQQDLPDYVFDCYVTPPRALGKADAPKAPGSGAKYKVWVGGARRQLLADLQTALKTAGLVPDRVALALLGPINAFEKAQPTAFAQEVVALVDLGFKSSSIGIVAEGGLCLSRVVEVGGDKLTSALSESMGISYGEAESLKVGMPQEVDNFLQPLLAPLGRELRASIDFFEHQQDRPVQQVFVSGAAASSEYILQTLQAELMVSCKAWSPLAGLELALPPGQMGEVEQVAPQLTVAIGAAALSY